MWEIKKVSPHMNGILEQLYVGFKKYNIYSLCICPVPISLSVVLITFDILFSLFFFFGGGGDF